MNIVLLGPPGSGKGTLGNKLREHYQLEEFVTGNELRRLARRDTPRGRRLKKILAGGNMASTELVMSVLQDRVSQIPEGKNGWLLDGVPRNRGQAQEFLKLLDNDELAVAGGLALEVEDEVARKRLPGRSTCPECGTIYNDRDNPPPQPGRCRPECGGELVRREDDTPTGIARRLHLYYQRTEPAIEMLEQGGVRFSRLDGEQPRQQVFHQACQVLEKQWAVQPPEPSDQPSVRGR